MSVASHEVRIHGELTQFPLKEFEVLEYLMRNKGRVLTRQQLIGRVWGSDYVGDTKNARRACQAHPGEDRGRSVESGTADDGARSRVQNLRRTFTLNSPFASIRLPTLLYTELVGYNGIVTKGNHMRSILHGACSRHCAAWRSLPRPRRAETTPIRRIARSPTLVDLRQFRRSRGLRRSKRRCEASGCRLPEDESGCANLLQSVGLRCRRGHIPHRGDRMGRL